MCEYCQSAAREPVESTSSSSTVEADANSVCAVCLGVVSPSFVAGCAAQLQQTLAQHKYSLADVSSFRLHLVVPNECVLRQAVVDMNSGGKPTNTAQLRRTLRHVYAQAIGERLKLAENSNLVSNQSIEFRVEPIVCISSSNSVCQQLQSATESTRVQPHSAKKAKLDSNGVNAEEEDASTAESAQLLVDSLTPTIAGNIELSINPTQLQLTSNVSVRRDSVFVAGRYCKYSRHLPQTPWTAGGGGRSDDDNDEPAAGSYETSVAEIITGVLREKIAFDSYKFMASGREDVDVRMLGAGRPFAIELINCRNTVELSANACEVECRVNSSQPDVRVQRLCLVTREQLKTLKDEEQGKQKQYTCVCRASQPVSSAQLGRLQCGSELMLQQTTPIRVLARRTLMCRQRTVQLRAVWPGATPHSFGISITTQAGTYVKEFVNGDFGRTVPSVGELLGVGPEVVLELLELDVDEVDLPWPPA